MTLFAGIAQRERQSTLEVAGSTPAPCSTTSAEENARDWLTAAAAVIAAAAIAVVLGLGGLLGGLQ